MFILSRLRYAVATGATFFAAFWIVEDLLTGVDTARLTKTAVMAISFGILAATFGHWWQEKWIAIVYRLLRIKQH